MKTKQPKALSGYEWAVQVRKGLRANPEPKRALKQPKISHKITDTKPKEIIPFKETIATCNKKVLGAVSLQDSQTRHQPKANKVSEVLPYNYSDRVQRAKLSKVKWTIKALETYPELDNLIDKKNYRSLAVNRLNQVGLQQMLLLAETARNRANINDKGYFAKCIGNKQNAWEGTTKPMLKALTKLLEKTKATLSKLGITDKDSYFLWFVMAHKHLSEGAIMLALERAQDKYFRQPRLKFVSELSKALEAKGVWHRQPMQQQDPANLLSTKA